jgi:hypothetical protein
VAYGATLVIVTGVTNRELAKALTQVKQRGRPITLLSFAQKAPPEVEGIRMFHLPFMEEVVAEG